MNNPNFAEFDIDSNDNINNNKDNNNNNNKRNNNSYNSRNCQDSVANIRNSVDMQHIINYLRNYSGRPLTIMEVCGTHTEAIVKSGIRELLSSGIRLVSGPGCPVCVTPMKYIDILYKQALQKNTTVISFGDMLKVSGIIGSLADAKAIGGNVEYIFNPMEVINMAVKNPKHRYVVAAVGFETTTPIFALMLKKIIENNITNIFFLTALKLIIPALELLCMKDNKIDGFIAPGHVSAIIGAYAYNDLSEKYHKPFTVAGFTDSEVLAAIYDLVKRIDKNISGVRNLYKNVVSDNGNNNARELVDRYFEKADAQWRGIGSIPDSGLFLKKEYSSYDLGSIEVNEAEPFVSGCMCSGVITGEKLPDECKLFGSECNPSSPKGPCMVSPEGACGIWHSQLRKGGLIK